MTGPRLTPFCTDLNITCQGHLTCECDQTEPSILPFMTPSPSDALRSFALDIAAEAPINRRIRELHVLGGLNTLESAVAHRIAEMVQVCRDRGASWAEIAATLHVSKQAAHERFGHRRVP